MRLGIMMGAAANTGWNTYRGAMQDQREQEKYEWEKAQRDKETLLDEKLAAVPQTQYGGGTALDSRYLQKTFGMTPEAADAYATSIKDGSVKPADLIKGLQADETYGANYINSYAPKGALPVEGAAPTKVPELNYYTKNGEHFVTDQAATKRSNADIIRDQSLAMLQFGGSKYIPQAVGMLEKSYDLHNKDLQQQAGEALRAPTEEGRIKNLSTLLTDSYHIPGKPEVKTDSKTGAVTVSMTSPQGDVIIPTTTFKPVDGKTVSQQMYEQLLGSHSFDNYVKLSTLDLTRQKTAAEVREIDNGKIPYYQSGSRYHDAAAAGANASARLHNLQAAGVEAAQAGVAKYNKLVDDYSALSPADQKGEKGMSLVRQMELIKAKSMESRQDTDAHKSYNKWVTENPNATTDQAMQMKAKLGLDTGGGGVPHLDAVRAAAGIGDNQDAPKPAPKTGLPADNTEPQGREEWLLTQRALGLGLTPVGRGGSMFGKGELLFEDPKTGQRMWANQIK